jgi:RNA recognition motif-containing protein
MIPDDLDDVLCGVAPLAEAPPTPYLRLRGEEWHERYERERRRRRALGDGSSRRRKPNHIQTKTGLPYSSTEKDLRAFFRGEDLSSGVDHRHGGGGSDATSEATGPAGGGSCSSSSAATASASAAALAAAASPASSAAHAAPPPLCPWPPPSSSSPPPRGPPFDVREVFVRRRNGRPTGWALAVLASCDEAAAAQRALHGRRIGNRYIE